LPPRSVRGRPAPRREFGDPAIGPVVDELGEHIGQICFRIDVVQLAGLDQRGRHRPVFRAFVAAGEQSILSAESNRPVILPLSGRKLWSITAGTRFFGRSVWRHYSEQRVSGRFVHVEAMPGVVTAIAAWILDPSPAQARRSARRA
jgi:hypothetical protein